MLQFELEDLYSETKSYKGISSHQLHKILFNLRWNFFFTFLNLKTNAKHNTPQNNTPNKPKAFLIKHLDQILIAKFGFYFKMLKGSALASLNKKYVSLKNLEVNILMFTNICVTLLLTEIICLISTWFYEDLWSLSRFWKKGLCNFCL